MNRFATVLKEARVSQGLKQDDVARMVGKTKNVVSNWERGDNKPDIDVLETLCRELSINPNDIINWKTGDVFSASPAEKKIIEKYRALDIFGKKAVDMLVDIEHERCKQTEMADVYVAARGNSNIPVQITQEQADEFVRSRDAKKEETLKHMRESDL